MSLTAKSVHRSLFLALLCLWSVEVADAGSNSWISIGPQGRRVLAFAIDPSNNKTIYATTDMGGVFKSTNGGDRWTTLDTSGTFLNSNDTPSIAIAPSNPNTVYVGTYRGILKSTNGGLSWIAFQIEHLDYLDAVKFLAIDPSDNKTIYAGSFYRGVFKSVDGGEQWASINNGLTNLQVRALAMDPLNTNNIYIGIGGSGVFKSTNGGASWAAINSGITGSMRNLNIVRAIAIDPSNTSTVYTILGAGIFKSENGGQTWTSLDYVGHPGAIAIAPSDTKIIYVATIGGRIYKSVNGGETWPKFNTEVPGPNVLAIAIDPSNPNTIYVGADEHGVFKSTNGGASWAAINAGIIKSPSKPSL